MEAIWHSNGDKVYVTVVKDKDGDYDCRPVDSIDPYANWTTYQSEIDNGTARLEFLQ